MKARFGLHVQPLKGKSRKVWYVDRDERDREYHRLKRSNDFLYVKRMERT